VKLATAASLRVVFLSLLSSVANASIFSAAVGAGMVACSTPSGPGSVEKPLAETRAPIVVTERGPGGGRLIAIDETGDRLFEVIAMPDVTIRDTNPAISPDGKWIVFASSRGRAKIEETSLWLAPLGVAVQPTQITRSPAAAPASVDTHPAWTRDGSAIVFASTRGGTFDLWEVGFEVSAGAPKIGEPVQLTSAPEQEITPSVAPDGSVAYAALSVIEHEGDKAGEPPEARSTLRVRGPDGTIRQLTEGPADSSPSYSPDGRQLAFSRPEVREHGVDADLWVMPAEGGASAAAHVLLSVPGTDESGPVWSRDERFVLATSLVRGGDGRPLFSSVIFFDRREAAPVARILVDRVGAVARLTPALSEIALREGVLRQRPQYLDILRDVLRKAIERAPALQPQ
jgi:Tol biopolymer transport system component